MCGVCVYCSTWFWTRKRTTTGMNSTGTYYWPLYVSRVRVTSFCSSAVGHVRSVLAGFLCIREVHGSRGSLKDASKFLWGGLRYFQYHLNFLAPSSQTAPPAPSPHSLLAQRTGESRTTCLCSLTVLTQVRMPSSSSVCLWFATTYPCFVDCFWDFNFICVPLEIWHSFCIPEAHHSMPFWIT